SVRADGLEQPIAVEEAPVERRDRRALSRCEPAVQRYDEPAQLARDDGVAVPPGCRHDAVPERRDRRVAAVRRLTACGSPLPPRPPRRRPVRSRRERGETLPLSAASPRTRR